MDDQHYQPPARSTYLLTGSATPLLPSCACFYLLAAANFSADPFLRILVLTIVTGSMGASIGWLAHRWHNTLAATVVTALAAPAIGYGISVFAVELIERLFAQWGWLPFIILMGIAFLSILHQCGLSFLG